jgi:hypothetical protein
MLEAVLQGAILELLLRLLRPLSRLLLRDEFLLVFLQVAVRRRIQHH